MEFFIRYIKDRLNCYYLEDIYDNIWKDQIKFKFRYYFKSITEQSHDFTEIFALF